MQALDYSVREPTGKAWLACLVGLVITGELTWERLQAKPAMLFGARFTDEELLWWSVAPFVVAMAGLLALLRLYLQPGRLVVDAGGGVLSRVRRGVLQRRELGGRLGEWSLRVLYFSEVERERHVFKRIELRGPNYSEAILWADVSDGEAWAKRLRELATATPAITEELERTG